MNSPKPNSMIRRIAILKEANLKVITLSIILGLLSLAAVSQDKNSIDLDEVSQKRVRKFIIAGAFDKMRDFSLIRPSWKKDVVESDFRIHEKTFRIKYGNAYVWNNYRHANSVEMWNGRSVRFGLLISKKSNTVTYSRNDFSPEIDTGQVYFLGLKFLKGLMNMPVAFEITSINQEDQIIEFSYLENNKSHGKQTIHIIDGGNGQTSIIHRTYFRSNSAIRDDLYPFFHKKFIREFHRNMTRSIKKGEIKIA